MKLPKRIKWVHVRRLYEALEPLLKFSQIKLKRPDSGRVLVLSPHIDDEVIGAGGSLRKHVQAGNEVRVVYFADCSGERIEEGRKAADIIGFRCLEFFEYGPKTLSEHPEIVDRLSAIIADYRPEIVYVPSLFDRHNDHLAVNNYLSVLFSRHRFDFTVYAYEVWTALVPNLIIDISDTIDAKKNAISQYGSQLSTNNWLDAAVSLNRYRGVTSGAGEYAEAFIRYSMKEHFALWEKVFGK